MARLNYRLGRESVSGLWEDIDEKRRQTGGWWTNMQTLRLRVYVDRTHEMTVSTLTPDPHAILELNIVDGRIFGVRVTGDGVYILQAGTPNVFMTLAQFIDWLMSLDNIKWPTEKLDAPHEVRWEVWTPTAPVHNFDTGKGGVWHGSHHGLQRALYLILGAFTR